MLVGVPKEVKTHEYRVGLVPGSVRELVHHGHKVVVESGAGAAIGFDDRAYEAAGAGILARAADVLAVAELIAARGDPGAARRPAPVHLSPSRRRRRADRGVDALRRHCHRL